MTGDLFDTQTVELKATGNLDKMKAWSPANGGSVEYHLVIGDQTLSINELVGKKLELQHTGNIHCCYCGEKTNKSFGQGYCYKHFVSLAQCDSCMMSPEQCHLSKGTCREPEWAETVCQKTHYVYLANASGIKVGITRSSQVPIRWMDQGAIQAMPIARVSSRYLSGVVEVMFKQHVSDKTNWRSMIKGDNGVLDLPAERDKLFELCQDDMVELVTQFGNQHIQWITHGDVYQFDYPVQQYPEKIKSVSFDKQETVGGHLLGVKGQYLIFDTGVINIRRHTGYEVNVLY